MTNLPRNHLIAYTRPTPSTYWDGRRFGPRSSARAYTRCAATLVVYKLRKRLTKSHPRIDTEHIVPVMKPGTGETE